ncbi:MAG: preprotein translocase subunit SecE [Clostridiales bacterium]|jgi:preprotein translocase subunit SecE|nr:preprotein translocase subunit SecE [Clostridiales bacterium]
MAQNSKKNETAGNDSLTVKKSDLAKLRKNKADDAKSKSAVSPQTPANTALAKRRNEIIERRQRAMAQAAQNKKLAKEPLKNGEKRPNFLVRFGRWLSKKFKEMRSELKKVTWPEPKDAVKQTLVVLAVVASFLVVLFVMDLGLSSLLKLLVEKAAESA